MTSSSLTQKTTDAGTFFVNEEGKAQGRATFYYDKEHTQVWRTQMFVNDRQHGLDSIWRRDGTKHFDTWWENGKRVKEFEYDVDGNIVDTTEWKANGERKTRGDL